MQQKFTRIILGTMWVGTAVMSAANAQPADPANLSLVAGYKAAFTCSAHFNAGRSVEEITGDELHRILPTFGEAMPSMPDAVIDEENKRVSVTYAEGFPPRIAQWRPHLGCTQLPTGASAIKFEDPRLAMMMAAPAREADARPEMRTFVYVEPKVGDVLLWESWLRHEVPMNMAEEERISISFNYGWE